ncbi:hypothetical protein [Flavobacterium sp. GT3R68]|uniref:hypothetical protein n=1 Tax=Flavobacterium sp. GT3R68 TaxID=2594437 RepID=UPI000F86FBA1|nr:hypothetical protein [Flavobacterium sp. GT3R68]RTY90871.1 hypothetical protein EKL32_20285 [Flavobacterium sp. GSN2]TRW93864.1 hypothetical protein FNW07_02845 [Flavobacterium sp. GT3R68]
MKIKTLSTLFISTCLISLCSSCNNDDDPSPSHAFFNINPGNKYVYKQYAYHRNIPGDVYTFNGIIDSIEITETVNLNGFTFSKQKRTRYNVNVSTTNGNVTYSYLRVNNAGNLVGYEGLYQNELPEDFSAITETSGTVFHPGEDYKYQYRLDLASGTAVYQLAGTAAIPVEVEGNPYTVLRYMGSYTPFNGTNPTRTVEIDYQWQKGLVRGQSTEIAGDQAWEDRLVSAVIVP